MRRRISGIFCVAAAGLFLTACMSTLPGVVVVSDLDTVPLAQKNVWVANFRNAETESAAFGQGRPDALRFERHLVAIPPEYRLGRVELPTSTVNPRTQFVSREVERFGSFQQLAINIEQTQGGPDEISLYVHGYNTSHAAAVYGFAQLLHDYELSFPAILFSWPSAAEVRGYVYDRDSVSISRNRLEGLIRDISRGGKSLSLVGHSMGTFLIMETLRQMEIRDPGSVGELVDEVVLLSPDIDPEVFRDQFGELKNPPSPFVIAISQKDRALRASSILTGTGQRLGSMQDPEEIADLPVVVIDMTDFADGTSLDHSTFATSERAIDFLRALRDQKSIYSENTESTILLGRRYLSGLSLGN